MTSTTMDHDEQQYVIQEQLPGETLFGVHCLRIQGVLSSHTSHPDRESHQQLASHNVDSKLLESQRLESLISAPHLSKNYRKQPVTTPQQNHDTKNLYSQLVS